MWLRLLELQSLILCSGQFYPIHGILISFLMNVVVHVLKNCVIITRFFFVGISTKRVKWCEKDSLPSSVAFMSTRNQSVLKDRLNSERTTPVKNFLFHIVKNTKKHHQLKVNFLSIVGMVLCVKKGRFAGKNVEGVRTSLLVASVTWTMGRTSLLDASLRLSQARFFSFCFLKFNE